MTQNKLSIKENIQIQRSLLSEALSKPMQVVAKKCKTFLENPTKLDKTLEKHIKRIPYCTNLYVMDENAIQLSSNVKIDTVASEYLGFNRSKRPYFLEFDAIKSFSLSSAYISLKESRPSITALHVIEKKNTVIGYIGVDIALKDLPVSIAVYHEPQYWRQIKGDPSIRQTVFQQTRSESIWDKNAETAISILKELIIEKGVFQAIIHFSSSQGTVWLTENPYEYRVLEADSWIAIDTCLAYPSRAYPEKAIIKEDSLSLILNKFQKLRHADDTLYLRSASLNIFNGLISLTFSCDGTHYLPYDNFLNKEDSFWGC